MILRCNNQSDILCTQNLLGTELATTTILTSGDEQCQESSLTVEEVVTECKLETVQSCNDKPTESCLLTPVEVCEGDFK